MITDNANATQKNSIYENVKEARRALYGAMDNIYRTVVAIAGDVPPPAELTDTQPEATCAQEAVNRIRRMAEATMQAAADLRRMVAGMERSENIG